MDGALTIETFLSGKLEQNILRVSVQRLDPAILENRNVFKSLQGLDSSGLGIFHQRTDLLGGNLET